MPWLERSDLHRHAQCYLTGVRGEKNAGMVISRREAGTIDYHHRRYMAAAGNRPAFGRNLQPGTSGAGLPGELAAASIRDREQFAAVGCVVTRAKVEPVGGEQHMWRSLQRVLAGNLNFEKSLLARARIQRV